MNKKEQLYDAVLRLTATQGLWDTPMSQIAGYANMAVGSIYHHFSSKEQLLSQLFIDCQLKIAATLTPAASIDSYQVEFKRLFLSGYTFFIENPLIYKYSVQVSHGPLLSDKDKKETMAFFDPFRQFFENGINKGYIQPGNSVLIAQFCYAQIKALAQIQIDGTLYVSDIQQQQIIDRSWNAISNVVPV